MTQYENRSQYSYFFYIFFQNPGNGPLNLGLNPLCKHTYLVAEFCKKIMGSASNAATSEASNI